jgi:hypothetical protein
MSRNSLASFAVATAEYADAADRQAVASLCDALFPSGEHPASPRQVVRTVRQRYKLLSMALVYGSVGQDAVEPAVRKHAETAMALKPSDYPDRFSVDASEWRRTRQINRL